MIGLVAVLKVKPGMEEKAVHACRKMVEEVHKHEKGCLLYEAYMPIEGAPEIYFLEKFIDMEALEEHRNTKHYSDFREAVDDALAAPPGSIVLKPI
jgi:quinol monooxygenase YgiN